MYYVYESKWYLYEDWILKLIYDKREIENFYESQRNFVKTIYVYVFTYTLHECTRDCHICFIQIKQMNSKSCFTHLDFRHIDKVSLQFFHVSLKYKYKRKKKKI